MKIVLAALLGLAVTAMPAAAKCKKPDLKGNWEFYGQVVYSDVNAWMACSMKVDKKGKISNKSSCAISIGATAKITSGKLKISKTCGVTGSFKSSDGATFDIEKAQMNVDKMSVQGAGQSYYGAFLFSSVKK